MCKKTAKNFVECRKCSIFVHSITNYEYDVAPNYYKMNAFDFDHLLVYLIAALLIAVFVLIFYNRIYVFREQEIDSLNKGQNARLRLVLQTGKLRLWTYLLSSRHYMRFSDTGEYVDEYNPVEFSQFFDRDDFEMLRRAIFDICEGKRSALTVMVRSNPAPGEEQRHYEMNVSVASRDAQGHITRLLGVQRDVTDTVRKEQEVNQLLMRYHTVFNSSLSDMMFYDKNGVLRDINDKACQSFHINDREKLLGGSYTLDINPFFNMLDFSRLERANMTSIVDFEAFRDERYHLESFALQGKMYYESSINAIRNADGEVEGVYVSGRNVTEMVESFHHQQEGMLQLRRTTENIKNYVRSINYALQVSDVRMVSYYPHSYTLELSTNINQTQLRLSQLRCIRLASPRFRRNVSSALNRMDHLTTHPIEQTIETEIRDQQGRPVWLMFNMVPLFDKDGRVERYFGMCRNVTEMVETERRLAVETKKAQETELLKQSFLTNMSYEIRTPLNTVVGFAELFEAEHDPADEPIFVEEIKKNSGSLLQLINDILFLSRLDANMIEYKREDADFALLFEGYCQIGWSSAGPQVKTIVDNPYEHLVVSIDSDNLGKVVEKLCALAASFTREGTIRAKCEYWRGELMLNIEDTGTGIDPETVPKVFGRFVRNVNEELCGTGLDLPIVQSLVQQMGGNIELQSELGKGTTTWITIPCDAKVIEKKRDILV